MWKKNRSVPIFSCFSAPFFWQLKISTDNEFINNSINYYFSIYDNIKSLNNSENKTIELFIDSEDNYNLRGLFLSVCARENKKFFVNKRFDVFQLNSDEYIISFYANTCICRFNILTKKIIGWFDRPERFGIDFIPNFIVIALIEIFFKFENRFFIHSSSLKKNDKGIIITGASGSGKSTLAFYLMTRGWQLLSDDKTFVWQEFEKINLAGLLQPVDVIKGKDDFLLNSGIIEKISENINDTIKTKIISAFKPDLIGCVTTPKIILFPKVSDSFSAVKLDKKNALLKLMKSSVTPNFNINLDAHFKILNKIVENSECYDILMDKDLTNISVFLETRL